MKEITTQASVCHSRESGNPVLSASALKRLFIALDPRFRGDDKRVRARVRPTLAILTLFALLLTGCATAPRFGPGTLTFVNQRSGEQSAVQYRMPDGTLDAAGLWQISYLMRDARAGEAMQMDPNLIAYLDAVVADLGLPPGAKIIVTSGYRAAETNAEMRRRSNYVAENSYHLRGQALDFKIPGVAGRRVFDAAKRVHRGGYAYYTSSDHVHIDTGPYRTWSTN